jgi:hypothetical protein
MIVSLHPLSVWINKKETWVYLSPDPELHKCHDIVTFLLPCCVVHTELSGHDHTDHPLPLPWTANTSTMQDGSAGHAAEWIAKTAQNNHRESRVGM